MRPRLPADGLDAMLVSDLVNVRYLSGFTGSNAALLVFAGRHADGAGHRRALPHPGRAAGARPRDRDRTGLRAASGRRGRSADGARRIGFESHVVTVDGFDALAPRTGRPAGAELVRASGTVEALREVKDAGEVALLRLACEAADAALADLVSAVACGRAAPSGRSAASWRR